MTKERGILTITAKDFSLSLPDQPLQYASDGKCQPSRQEFGQAALISNAVATLNHVSPDSFTIQMDAKDGGGTFTYRQLLAYAKADAYPEKLFATNLKPVVVARSEPDKPSVQELLVCGIAGENGVDKAELSRIANEQVINVPGNFASVRDAETGLSVTKVIAPVPSPDPLPFRNLPAEAAVATVKSDGVPLEAHSPMPPKPWDAPFKLQVGSQYKNKLSSKEERGREDTHTVSALEPPPKGQKYVLKVKINGAECRDTCVIINMPNGHTRIIVPKIEGEFFFIELPEGDNGVNITLAGGDTRTGFDYCSLIGQIMAVPAETGTQNILLTERRKTRVPALARKEIAVEQPVLKAPPVVLAQSADELPEGDAHLWPDTRIPAEAGKDAAEPVIAAAQAEPAEEEPELAEEEAAAPEEIALTETEDEPEETPAEEEAGSEPSALNRAVATVKKPAALDLPSEAAPVSVSTGLETALDPAIVPLSR